MLIIMPKGPFSQHYVVVNREEQVLAELRPLRMRDSAEFELHGRVYRLHHPELMAGPLVLESAEGILAEVIKPSPLSRSLLINYGGQSYELEPKGVAGRADQLHHNGQLIGEIHPQTITSRNLVLDTIPGLSEELLICLAWLAILRLGHK